MSRLVMSFFFCCATLVALVSAQESAPKALPCSLPAPNASTPAVKGTEAWTATGGNEISKLNDMAALSFEKWLKAGSEGAASAAAACTSANVAKYTIDVKSACKKIENAEKSSDSSAENGAGMQYALQYEVSYSCRAKGGSSSPSRAASSTKKASNASSAPSPALAAAAAPSTAPSGPVKIEATLRSLVTQPPLKEAADGSLVRPKPQAKETWFVEGTTETSAVFEKTVKKSLGGGGSRSAAAAAAGAPSSKIISTEEKEVAPVGSALAQAFGGSGGSGSSSSSSSSLSNTISSVGAALASALDAAAGADAHVGDALDAAVADYRDSYYDGAPRGGAVIITSPVGVGFNGLDAAAAFDNDDAALDSETSGGDFNGSADDDDFTTLPPRPASTMSSSSSSMKLPMHESAAEEGKRVAREAAASAANALAAARPE